MSFETVFLLVSPKDEVVAVSPFLNALDALEGFKRGFQTGKMFAARLSDTVAFELKQKVENGKPGVKDQTALSMVKLYAQTLNFCGDVT